MTCMARAFIRAEDKRATHLLPLAERSMSRAAQVGLAQAPASQRQISWEPGSCADLRIVHRTTHSPPLAAARYIHSHAPVQDDAGNTPWHAAARAGNVDALHIFMGHGVPVDTRDGAGRTALHTAACANGAAAVAPALLRGGASAGAACARGQTPLHCAARAGLTSLVQLLLPHVGPEDVKRQVGAPPHGGMEVGAGRLVVLLECVLQPG